jgi:hypothetical protein
MVINGVNDSPQSLDHLDTEVKSRRRAVQSSGLRTTREHLASSAKGACCVAEYIRQVINVQKEEKRSQNTALKDTRCYMQVPTRKMPHQ